MARPRRNPLSPFPSLSVRLDESLLYQIAATLYHHDEDRFDPDDEWSDNGMTLSDLSFELAIDLNNKQERHRLLTHIMYLDDLGFIEERGPDDFYDAEEFGLSSEERVDYVIGPKWVENIRADLEMMRKAREEREKEAETRQGKQGKQAQQKQQAQEKSEQPKGK